MAANILKKSANLLLLLSVLVFSYIVASFFFFSTPPSTAKIENIHGIPYPLLPNGDVVITEKLAHADINLKRSVLGKKLRLTVTFTPFDTKKLEAGIRENSFWLSYPKQELYSPPNSADADLPVTRTLTFDLTDKLQESNGTIDLMFFAANADSRPVEDEGISDSTYWLLHSVHVSTANTRPSLSALKNYLKSKITREKAL